MASSITSTSITSDASGADFGFLKDQNVLTIAGVALGATTLGATAVIGAVSVPGSTLSGLIMTGMCLGGGHLKKTTGSCLPFLGDKKDVTPTLVTPVTTVA
tara:strand:+ start:1336 stop:1638 length:303 start_codon:yes stop_codon:yes gene_type:complete